MKEISRITRYNPESYEELYEQSKQNTILLDREPYACSGYDWVTICDTERFEERMGYSADDLDEWDKSDYDLYAINEDTDDFAPVEHYELYQYIIEERN